MNSIKALKLSLLIISTCLATSCFDSADERYDVGHSDGYAEGYNTTCKIRSTLIEGDWDDKNYSMGYEDGRSQGVAACRASK